MTNNSPVDLNSFRKESGYVMQVSLYIDYNAMGLIMMIVIHNLYHALYYQSDALFPLLTVRETFRYAAYLRIANKTIQQKHEIVGNLAPVILVVDSHSKADN